MPYQTSQASVRVQCDDCAACNTFHANSVAAAVTLARDDGWKIRAATQRGCITIGPCVCAGCIEERKWRIADRRAKRVSPA